VSSPENFESAANTLCKACGLCCSGHLFAWVKLRSPELAPIQDLGVPVFRESQNRGFNQPCPLWDGQCTIYDSPHYPHFCRVYKCQLLKKLMDGTTDLSQALRVVEQTKQMIGEVETLLPASLNRNFRERLVAHLESSVANPEFQEKGALLLDIYKDIFGVKDLINTIEEK
jgi:hypothetical protein